MACSERTWHATVQAIALARQSRSVFMPMAFRARFCLPGAIHGGDSLLLIFGEV